MMKIRLVTLISFATLLSPTGTQAKSNGQITQAEINAAVERATPAMVGLRHQVHQHPELSNRINHATNFVAEDSSIPIGIRAMTEVLLEYLGR
jgi:hypothetical protein